MPLDSQTPSLSSLSSALPEGVAGYGVWRRLVAWFRGSCAQDPGVPTEGEILHMDDWMLKDIGAPTEIRDLAAQIRARHSRGGWDVHIW